jgi:hypothetical protein
MSPEILPGSFRDPSGFLYRRDGVLLRQVNPGYRDHYDHLMRSGLYDALAKDGLLIPHREADPSLAATPEAHKVLQPEPIPFISYPSEWCFSELRDAALLTLRVQKLALAHGMSLKDCSAYNVQFAKGQPVFVDTLSFERYREGEPWVAYRQFCQHFLAPLALIVHKDSRLNQLSRIYLDGIPLDLASSLLPAKTRFSFSLLSHIHLHAKAQQHAAGTPRKTRSAGMSRTALLGLVDSLEAATRNLHWKQERTTWADYYDQTNYTQPALQEKEQVVADFLARSNPQTVWDLGANIGRFSRVASRQGRLTISFDIDHTAVEANYQQCVREGETNLLPLVADLTNPLPGLGWEHRERASWMERGPADAVLALALVHHLAIANNLPLPKLASFFRRICSTLIVEFVPKSDSQVQRLLASREDIFPDYAQEPFEQAFQSSFRIKDTRRLRESERILYHMEKTT